MGQDKHKQQAAAAALDYIEDDMVIGVGTGTTVDFFIERLASIKHKIQGAVASSQTTEKRLKDHHIPLLNPNSVVDIPLYIDSADEATSHFQLIKGGGGALTGEKILLANAKKFICIIDTSKMVDVLGQFPVPVEVIPMARSYVARQIVKLGGDPVYREGVVTDFGNQILDVYNLKITDPNQLETTLDSITGVVSNGLFAHRHADVLLIGTDNGVDTRTG